jgi:hypothetical protein
MPKIMGTIEYFYKVQNNGNSEIEPFIVHAQGAVYTEAGIACLVRQPGKQDLTVLIFIVKIAVRLYGQTGWPSCRDLT